MIPRIRGRDDKGGQAGVAPDSAREGQTENPALGGVAASGSGHSEPATGSGVGLPPRDRVPVSGSSGSERKVWEDGASGAESSGTPPRGQPYYWWGPHAKLRKLQKMPPEPQEGNIEYKLQLVDVTAEKFTHLVTQCKWRLEEGKGVAFYHLGVRDDGDPRGLSDVNLEKSINTIKSVAARVRCEAQILSVRRGTRGKVAHLQIRHYKDVQSCSDVRICVVGDEGSGKSTLVGVLTGGFLDDGRGLARMDVFKHRHEIEDGRTSSASMKLLGYDEKGRITNYTEFGGEWSDLVEASDKVLTLIDLGGHERYLKTTLANLSGRRPDYAAVVVGADKGVQDMTSQHYQVTQALGIPCFFVLNKMDVARKDQIRNAIAQIRKVVAESSAAHARAASPVEKKKAETDPPATEARADAKKKDATPLLLFGCDEAGEAGQAAADEGRGGGAAAAVGPKIASAPNGAMNVFAMSCVTGRGLAQLKAFLRGLPRRRAARQSSGCPCEFAVSEAHHIDEVGLVLTGTVIQGTLRQKQQLMLGPMADGSYKRANVQSIHSKRVATRAASVGMMASIAVEGVTKADARPGTMLVDPCVKRVAVRTFDAEVWPVEGGGRDFKLSPAKEYVVLMGAIRQPAKIVSFEGDSGWRGAAAGNEGPQQGIKRGPLRARFRFCFHPEHVRVNSRFVFRERRAEGAGTVISVEDMNAIKRARAMLRDMPSQFLSRGCLIRQSSGDTPAQSPLVTPVPTPAAEANSDSSVSSVASMPRADRGGAPAPATNLLSRLSEAADADAGEDQAEERVARISTKAGETKTNT